MKEKFDEIDEILASFEDWMHGIDGDNCAKARRLLREIQNEYLNSKKMPSDEIRLGMFVYHKDIYRGRERMKIVGIRENEIELEGDYSGGIHNVCQRDWGSREGIIKQSQDQTKEKILSDEVIPMLSNGIEELRVEKYQQEKNGMAKALQDILKQSLLSKKMLSDEEIIKSFLSWIRLHTEYDVIPDSRIEEFKEFLANK